MKFFDMMTISACTPALLISRARMALFLFSLIIGLIVLQPTTGRAQHNHHAGDVSLREAGNDIFGTIREVVLKLEADPATDWRQVNLEALRRHLLDMNAFTEAVTVLSQEPVEGGIRIRVRPQNERAQKALRRVLGMHPAMLMQETGWTMEAARDEDAWIITCTTEGDAAEVARIRGLGYIGLLATGAHHQRHHWMIATGRLGMQ